MGISLNLCTASNLTVAQLFAADAASTLRPCSDYKTTFTGRDGNTHTFYYQGGQSGKFPGHGLLLHSNGGLYMASAVLIPAAAGIPAYPSDSLEMVAVTDPRLSNTVVSSVQYIALLGENPVWHFPWGDNNVQGNTLHNSRIYTDTGNLPGGTSYIRNNHLSHGTELYIQDSGTPKVEQFQMEGMVLKAANISFTATDVDPSFAYEVQMTNGMVANTTLSVVLTSTFQAVSMEVQGMQVSVTSCGFSCSDLKLFQTNPNDSSALLCAGTGSAGEDVSFVNSRIENAAVTVTVSGAQAYSALDIQGWTVELSPAGETGLVLSRAAMSGHVVYDSNKVVEKNVSTPAEYEVATGKIILDGSANPADLYAGVVILDGISSNSISPTLSYLIDPGSSSPAGRRIRLQAGKNSGGTYAGYLRLNTQTDTTVAAQGMVFGTTANMDAQNATNMPGSVVLRGFLNGSARYWLTETLNPV